MRIILCDDNLEELNQLEEMTRACIEKVLSPEEYTVQSYSNAKKLSFDLEDKARADLYILDIDMPEISGIALAKQIQNIQPQAFVYFYTSHSEFATEGYRVEARRYLLKGGNPAFFTEAIEFACDQVAKRRQSQTSLPFYHETINVPISDIMYVERTHRQVFVHTHENGTIQTSLPLHALFLQISQPQFVYIDRGTFINVEFVCRTEKDSVVLFNKTKLYISQNRIVDVKKAVALYWRGNL